ncbi:hypothetical protein [uncultured Coprobacter sp.]|uniref:hypothetical protein n=1 Tax=uncultured Coprobacter sp. TaxID=1720550 RepID=UPI002597CD45|nr:hypothetical protein [uncultured Coprobacter sp.]
MSDFTPESWATFRLELSNFQKQVGQPSGTSCPTTGNKLRNLLKISCTTMWKLVVQRVKIKVYNNKNQIGINGI